jgi:hypothetical protein
LADISTTGYRRLRPKPPPPPLPPALERSPLGRASFTFSARPSTAWTLTAGNRFIALAIVWHLHEAEAAGLARITIGANVDTINSAVGLEQRTDRIFRSPKTEVSNVNVFQSVYFLSLI